MQKENTAPTRASQPEFTFSAQMNDTVPFQSFCISTECQLSVSPATNGGCVSQRGETEFTEAKSRTRWNTGITEPYQYHPWWRGRICLREIQDTLEHRHYRNIGRESSGAPSLESFCATEKLCEYAPPSNLSRSEKNTNSPERADLEQLSASIQLRTCHER